MKRKYRLFYPSGIISLIFLPILCIWYLKTNIKAQPLYAMDVAVYNSSDIGNDPISRSFKEIPSLRTYQLYVFTGVDEIDLQSLNKAKQHIRQLIKTNDTTKGIVFQFGNHSKYWNWVKAIDIANQVEPKFLVTKNLIYMYHGAPDANSLHLSQMFICGTTSAYVEKQMEEERNQVKLEYDQARARYCAFPLFFFLAMCYFTFRKRLCFHCLARTSKIGTL
jgi:hypothetical protein